MLKTPPRIPWRAPLGALVVASLFLIGSVSISPGELVKSELEEFVEGQLRDFHQRRLERLDDLKIDRILKRKNPYLFRAKSTGKARDFVRALVDAHLSSQEEGLFGTVLESVAIFVSEKSVGGRKSSAQGVDLEFEREDTKYLVSIKSGPNWGNSSQIAEMRDDFRKAKRILGTNTKGSKVVAINGCAYGKTTVEDKGDYLKLCGQSFWEFLSGDSELYQKLLVIIGEQTQANATTFREAYEKRLDELTAEFSRDYSHTDGEILWEKILEYNSARPE